MKKHPAGWSPRVGDVVQISFRDHTEVNGENQGLLDFSVFGRLAHIDKHSYTVHSWAYTGEPPEGEGWVHNITGFSIARSAIVDIFKLIRPRRKTE